MSVGLDPSMLSSQAQAGIDVQNKLRVDALTRTLNAGDTEEKKLREACRGFESAFLQKLMVQMRATVPKDGLLHGPYEDQYLSMFDQALADKLAESGGVGLADMMFSQLKDKIAGTKKSSSHRAMPPKPAAGPGKRPGPDRTRTGRPGCGPGFPPERSCRPPGRSRKTPRDSIACPRRPDRPPRPRSALPTTCSIPIPPGPCSSPPRTRRAGPPKRPAGNRPRANSRPR